MSHGGPQRVSVGQDLLSDETLVNYVVQAFRILIRFFLDKLDSLHGDWNGIVALLQQGSGDLNEENFAAKKVCFESFLSFSLARGFIQDTRGKIFMEMLS